MEEDDDRPARLGVISVGDEYPILAFLAVEVNRLDHEPGIGGGVKVRLLDG